MIENFRTSDGRWITFMMVQPGRYFADVCTHLGPEHLLEDTRFQNAEGSHRRASPTPKTIAP